MISQYGSDQSMHDEGILAALGEPGQRPARRVNLE